MARLFVVATPIGNLNDISLRARDILRDSSVIACEDTRRLQKLMRALDIPLRDKDVIVLNQAVEAEATIDSLERLESGSDVVLVSDAGTPLISDPGHELVKKAYARAIPVVPIPGPSALTAVLSVCPLPVNEFQFVGFLKRKPREKRHQIRRIAQSSVTTIFFESPMRLLDTLRLMDDEGLGSRQIFIGRELTKLYEELTFGPVADVRQTLENNASNVKGELIVVLDRMQEKRFPIAAEELIDALASRLKPSETARVTAKLTGENRDEIYGRILAKRSQSK